MRNFKELKIWQKRYRIAIECFKITTAFPLNEKYGLISQITRSASSIPANIAEGSSRSSDKDYARFIEIALGSCFELETHLLIATDLRYGDEALTKNLLDLIQEEQKMLHSFVTKLKSQ